jgi:hypothetical protein
MPAHRSQQLRRANLFLVRVWASDSREANGSNNSHISGRAEWCGSVQRVVDGESYRFDGWRNLTEILDAMISGSTPNSAQSASSDDNSQLSNL